MNNNIIKILKDKNYVVPSYILENYKNLNISLDSFVVLIYLLNLSEPILSDVNTISEKLNMNKKEAIFAIDELKTKKIINIKLEENKEKRLEENIYLTPLYEKVFMNLIEEKKKKKWIYIQTLKKNLEEPYHL